MITLTDKQAADVRKALDFAANIDEIQGSIAALQMRAVLNMLDAAIINADRFTGKHIATVTGQHVTDLRAAICDCGRRCDDPIHAPCAGIIG